MLHFLHITRVVKRIPKDVFPPIGNSHNETVFSVGLRRTNELSSPSDCSKIVSFLKLKTCPSFEVAGHWPAIGPGMSSVEEPLSC